MSWLDDDEFDGIWIAQPKPCTTCAYAAQCRVRVPGGQGFIDHGYCRTSLDALVGSSDPRCPADCRHKAPASVVVRFEKQFSWRGAKAAAAWARAQRKKA